ncbi:hypothetical protein ACFLS1_01535 [Verrucomicrobiota bacterium]
MNSHKIYLFVYFFFVASLVSGVAPDFDIGPVGTGDLSLEGNKRLRSIGPVFECQATGDGTTFKAIRPFFSTVEDPGKNRRLDEYLWPIGMCKQLRKETYWRFLNAFGHDFDNTDGKSRFRFVIFPLVFGGRDKNLEEYFALFPVGGRIHEFLSRDKITFFLFPLYASSVTGDLKTLDILWPFISRAKGTRVSRFRVFPFYGRSKREGEYDKMFAMWPVWTSATFKNPSHKGHSFILFPLFGHARVNHQMKGLPTRKSETWWVLPPFFKWAGDGTHVEWNCPYPFLQYSSGKIDKLYIWPLWGTRTYKNNSSQFFLWPVFRWYKTKRPNEILKRFYMVPLVQYESRVRETVGEAKQKHELPYVTARYFKLWPLLSYRREYNEAYFRMLDLWPTKHLDSVERNLAPFWTLYSHERLGSEKEDELLWGLYRHRRGPKSGRKVSIFPLFLWRTNKINNLKEWRFLMGLAGYKRENRRKTFRLLYLLKWSSGGVE